MYAPATNNSENMRCIRAMEFELIRSLASVEKQRAAFLEVCVASSFSATSRKVLHRRSVQIRQQLAQLTEK